jgi:hypothetical protein
MIAGCRGVSAADCPQADQLSLRSRAHFNTSSFSTVSPVQNINQLFDVYLATMGSISIRKSIRWLPDEASEPTSTIVLTSPQRRFVDLRILGPAPHLEVPLGMGAMR